MGLGGIISGGKYGEPTISKLVVYERLELFELLDKSDPMWGPKNLMDWVPSAKVVHTYYSTTMHNSRNKNQPRIIRLEAAVTFAQFASSACQTLGWNSHCQQRQNLRYSIHQNPHQKNVSSTLAVCSHPDQTRQDTHQLPQLQREM